MAKQKKSFDTLIKYKDLHWELIIPLASLIIYGSSYLFQIGYNSTYGIPSSLASLDFTKISSSIIPLLLIVGVSIIGLDIIYNVADYNPEESSHQYRAAYTLIFLDFWILYLIQSLSLSFWKSILHMIGATIIFLIIGLILKYVPDKILFWHPFKNRLTKKQTKSKNTYRSAFGRLIPHPRETVLGILIVILLGLLVFLIGGIYSGFQTSYLVESKNYNMVVLNTYNGDFIIGSISKTDPRLLTDKYQILSSSTNISLTKRHISKLSTVNLKQQNNIEILVKTIFKDTKNIVHKNH